MNLDDAKILTLDDKAIFDEYFKRFPPLNSEFTFTNLFMWRNFYELYYFVFDSHLIVYSNEFLRKRKTPASGNKNAKYFFPPVGPNPTELMKQIMDQTKDVEFHRVPEKIINQFDKDYSDVNLEIQDDRDNWDYVYDAEEIINLHGNKYRQNRRWLNKFLESYEYEFQTLTEETVEKTKELQLEWCILRECEDDEGLEQEHEAIYEALDNFRTLGFTGAVICIDGGCAAYTFGEMLKPDTLVIHVEKAHMKYHGGYQAINNLFLKNCFPNVKYVNREQDLGVDGLRKAKESYKPIYMVKKYIVFPKQH
jgi:uncharacterized protein